MLQEEVFLFVAPKSHFYFPSTKNGRFCEATTKWLIQNTTTTFYKNTIPPYMDNVPTGVSETFPSTFGEKDKFVPNRQEFVFFTMGGRKGLRSPVETLSI